MAPLAATEPASTPSEPPEEVASWMVVLISVLTVLLVIASVAIVFFTCKYRRKTPADQTREQVVEMPHPDHCNPPASPVDPLPETRTAVGMNTVITRQRDSGYVDEGSSARSSDGDQTVQDYLPMDGGKTKKPPYVNVQPTSDTPADKNQSNKPKYVNVTLKSDSPLEKGQSNNQNYMNMSVSASCPALNVADGYVKMDPSSESPDYMNPVSDSHDYENEKLRRMSVPAGPVLPPKTSNRVKVRKEGLPPTIKVPKIKQSPSIFQ